MFLIVFFNDEQQVQKIIKFVTEIDLFSPPGMNMVTLSILLHPVKDNV
jgi:hypothetical protein